MRVVNMTGKRFGNLKVIKPSRRTNEKKQMFWVCRCDCGRLLRVRSDNLRSGNTSQCSYCSGRGGKISDFICDEVIHDES